MKQEGSPFKRPSSDGWGWGFGMTKEPMWKLWAVKTAVGSIVGENWPWKFGGRGESNLVWCRAGMAVLTEHQRYIWYFSEVWEPQIHMEWLAQVLRCWGMYFPHSRFSVLNPFVTRDWLIFFAMSCARVQMIHLGLTTVLPHLAQRVWDVHRPVGCEKLVCFLCVFSIWTVVLGGMVIR
jgi:hypothetical protein